MSTGHHDTHSGEMVSAAHVILQTMRSILLIVPNAAFLVPPHTAIVTTPSLLHRPG